jgi:hypothetical protein
MRRPRTIVQRRFPPWQVVELPGGYAVEDASGRRLSAFYASREPRTAKQAGALSIEEARQMAVDFARLPELLKRGG